MDVQVEDRLPSRGLAAVEQVDPVAAREWSNPDQPAAKPTASACRANVALIFTHLLNARLPYFDLNF